MKRVTSFWSQWNLHISTFRTSLPETVIEKLGQRKGELRQHGRPASGGLRPVWNSSIPSRGLIGYRGEFMTDTKGNGIMNTTVRQLCALQGRYPVPQAGLPDRIRGRRMPSPTVCSMHRSAAHSSSEPVKRYTPEWLSVRPARQ